jgi:ATP synthase protein I
MRKRIEPEASNLLERGRPTPMKALQNRAFEVFSSVAMNHRHHYNARPEQGPSWTNHHHYATHRRQADGSGVFSARGKRKGGQQMIVAKILLAQLCLSVVLAMLFWGIDGHVSGYSALLGGLTCVIPNAFLALRLVVSSRDPGASALVNAAYIGELGKLGLTVLMFSLVFTLVRPLAAGALFAGFIAAQLVTFSGFLMRDKHSEVKESNRNGD